MQFSVEARNAQLDAIEAVLGASPILKIFTGAVPANCAAADSGTVLASMTLPVDALAAAALGVKAKSGTWSVVATGTDTAQHFRLYKSDGTTCVNQGSVGTSAADMIVNSVAFTAGQTFIVTVYQWTAGNA